MSAWWEGALAGVAVTLVVSAVAVGWYNAYWRKRQEAYLRAIKETKVLLRSECEKVKRLGEDVKEMRSEQRERDQRAQDELERLLTPEAVAALRDVREWLALPVEVVYSRGVIVYRFLARGREAGLRTWVLADGAEWDDAQEVEVAVE